MRGQRVVTLLAWLVLWIAMPALANVSNDNDALIEERVRSFLTARTGDLGKEVSIDVHDGIARLPECLNPQPFLPRPDQRLYGRVSVGLHCGSQGEQTRYLLAEVSVLVDHVVAAREIIAGALLTAADLTL
ncbi:MAG: flagellar basal body P-ring formation protein FlgA, partial [Halomonas sp.]|nr:flagellar basal body P-ring formation protein FlgA [Halomonas sp.]